jgi:glucan phosphoethanolaminetransferase (alkaline phosphatase superfamily)
MEKPQSVTNAALLWTTAVVAGVIETLFAVSEIAQESGVYSGLWTSVGVRAVVYIGVMVIVAIFASGRRWARWALAVLLSVIGLASLVVEPARLLMDGTPFLEAFGGDGDLMMGIFVARMLHIAAVLAATAVMFSPSANAYFKKPALQAA